MRFGIKHKIIVSFLCAVGFVIVAGLLIERTVRSYDNAVRGISASGWELRTVKEVLNYAREMRVIHNALHGDPTRARARSLLSATHIRIQDHLARITTPAEAVSRLRLAYAEYWKIISALDERADTGGPAVAEQDHLDGARVVHLLDRIEKAVYDISEESITRMGGLYDTAASTIRLERVLRLPDAYYRAMGDLVSSFDHIFVYDEIWSHVLDLQVNAFAMLSSEDSSREEQVREIMGSLNIWLESEIEGVSPIVGIRPFQKEEKELFLQLQDWINGYLSKLSSCTRSRGADMHDCYLDAFEKVAVIQARIVRHSLDEARYVEETIATTTGSIVALAETYTFFFFGISLMAGLIAFYLFREVLGPVRTLRTAFERFGEGRFNYRIPGKRRDEFRELHEGFNTMAAAVERRDHDLMAARIDLENLAFKIQNYSEDLEDEVRRRTAELLRAYEDLKRNDRLKSEFIANMSHELRTPLNSIIGFSKVILKGIDGPITDRQRDDLQLINQSGRHLLDLITQILDFSKLEAGRLDLRMERVEVEGVAADVVATLRPMVKDKPIEFGYVSASPGLTVLADRTRLVQIVMNLLSNALKFTDRGEVRLDIRAWEASDSLAPAEPVAFDQGVLLSVTDTGIGIPAESAELIFQKFQQVDGSSTRAYGGTGLGLAITRELVLMHGGYIWFTSSTGQGTTFHVLLPSELTAESREERVEQTGTESA